MNHLVGCRVERCKGHRNGQREGPGEDYEVVIAVEALKGFPAGIKSCGEEEEGEGCECPNSGLLAIALAITPTCGFLCRSRYTDEESIRR